MALVQGRLSHIFNEDNENIDFSDINWSPKNLWKNHFQGIAQAGNEYIILSSSVNDKALLLAYNKKIVQVKCLPKEYDHAGGLDVLDVKNGENGENGWMIAVPVYKVDQDDQGAILRYFLPDGKGTAARLTDRQEIISLPTKAYTAGIGRMNDDSVVIAVVIDKDGKQVQFLKCNAPDGQGTYNKLGVWNACKVNKKKRKKLGWIDKYWGGYPNSISLIDYGGQIYFVGMHVTGQTGAPVLSHIWQFLLGRSWVDIYSVILTNEIPRWLIKKFKQRVRRYSPIGPSFRYGGNVRILSNGKVEVLAVGPKVHNNCRIDYYEYKIDIQA